MFANLIYTFALTLMSPYILYRMVRHKRYRRGWSEKLLGLSSKRSKQMVATGDCIWLHAVSVGEVNLIGGIVDRLQIAAVDTTIVISTSTDSGYDLAVQKFGIERVFFCPLDFSWAVRRTLRNLNPSQLVLAELELWPNLIRFARHRGIRVSVINGRLSPRGAGRYLRFSRWTRPTFQRLDWVGCQDQSSRDRFLQCGVPSNRLDVTGSIKFDDARQFTRVAQGSIDARSGPALIRGTGCGSLAAAGPAKNRWRLTSTIICAAIIRSCG